MSDKSFGTCFIGLPASKSDCVYHLLRDDNSTKKEGTVSFSDQIVQIKHGMPWRLFASRKNPWITDATWMIPHCGDTWTNGTRSHLHLLTRSSPQCTILVIFKTLHWWGIKYRSTTWIYPWEIRHLIISKVLIWMYSWLFISKQT